jgi:hypothetical protein
MSTRAARPDEPANEKAPTAQEAATGQTETTPMEDPMSDTIAPPAEATHSAPEERHIRVGTVVWGLVLAAIGTGLLAASLGVAFDVELAFIVLVAAAGVLLLVGSVASSRRRRR